MSLNRRMSDAHEKHLVEVLGGRRTRGSGNQFHNPADGRNNRYNDVVAFAWDGKSTRGQSIAVSRSMWAKIQEQSHGERPMLPLRFYDSDRLQVGLDLVVITLDDCAEMISIIEGK